MSKLLHCFNPNYLYEIGVDESGRGPMFGRLYVSAVVLFFLGSYISK
jgi:ribonuclease HIII